MTLYLELDTNPRGTSQMKGESVVRGRIHHFEKANVRQQRAIYHQKILEAIADSGMLYPDYGDEPIYLSVVFYYQIKQKKRWGQWKTSKPDLDNAVKLLQDVLCDMGFFKDDSQIASLKVKKYLSERPGILIEMGRLMQP